MLSLLVLATVQAAPVDFTGRAERLELLIPRLSEQLHRPLSVSRDLADEVVLISVHGIGEDRLLDEIAAVTNAEWTPSGDTLKLQRTPDRLRQLAAEESRIRCGLYIEAQKKLRADAEKRGSFSESMARKLGDLIDAYYRRDGLDDHENRTNAQTLKDFDAWDQVMDSTPASYAVRNLIANLDPQTFLDLEDGDRRILDRWPTRTQGAIGNNGESAVQTFLAGQRLWAKEISRRGERVPPAIRQGWDPYDHAEVPHAKDLGVRIQVMPYLSADYGFQFLTTFRTKTGTQLHYSTEVLTGLPTADQWAPAELLASKTPLVLPDEVLKFRRSYEQLRGPATPGSLSARFRNCLTYDPLSFTLAPTLRQAAEQSKRGIVAYVPDPSLLLRISDEAQTVGKFWELMTRQLQIEDDGQILRVRPLFPLLESRRRAPRAALQELVSQAPETGPSLDSIAKYTLARRTNGTDMVLRQYLGILTPASLNAETPDPTILRLYATLTDVQMRRFLRGESLSLDEMSQRQQEFVRTALLRRQGIGFSPQRAREMTSLWKNERPLDITDIFANGVPANLQVSLKVSTETVVVRRYSESGQTHLLPISLHEEVERAMTYARNRNNIDGYLSGLTQIGVGKQRQLTFQFALDPETVFERSLNDSIPSVKFGRFTDLPKETQNAMRQAMMEEVQRRKSVDDSAPTRKSPPPR